MPKSSPCLNHPLLFGIVYYVLAIAAYFQLRGAVNCFLLWRLENGFLKAPLLLGVRCPPRWPQIPPEIPWGATPLQTPLKWLHQASSGQISSFKKIRVSQIPDLWYYFLWKELLFWRASGLWEEVVRRAVGLWEIILNHPKCILKSSQIHPKIIPNSS